MRALTVLIARRPACRVAPRSSRWRLAQPVAAREATTAQFLRSGSQSPRGLDRAGSSRACLDSVSVPFIPGHFMGFKASICRSRGAINSGRQLRSTTE
jgi:hypothetical protein